MTESKEIDNNLLLKLLRYAFLRLDGAWFIASANKFGIDLATELDIDVWENFSERLGKRITQIANFSGVFSEDITKLMKIHNLVMNMNTQIKIEGEKKATFRVLDCEIWKMVSKVWAHENIPCHKVTNSTIKGLLKGAFPEKNFVLNQTKKIPLGDPFCEIEILFQN